MPYQELPRQKIKLPKRQKPGGDRDPKYQYKVIEEVF
jgi:hypothetical protein